MRCSEMRQRSANNITHTVLVFLLALLLALLINKRSDTFKDTSTSPIRTEEDPHSLLKNLQSPLLLQLLLLLRVRRT